MGVARGGSRGSAEPPLLRNQNKKGPKYLNFMCKYRKSKLDLF